MPELKERLRAIESAPPPDLWPEIDRRVIHQHPLDGVLRLAEGDGHRIACAPRAHGAERRTPGTAADDADAHALAPRLPKPTSGAAPP